MSQNKKIIRLENKVIVLFEDGTYLENDDISDDTFKKIYDSDDVDEIATLMCPEFKELKEEYINTKELLASVETSELLTLKGESVYWEEVSGLSMPFKLVKAILKAEANNDEVLIDTYKNFWTLMSLNPDEECRKNLFWFLEKWGLKISRCGFFVAYRNANFLGCDYDGTEVYTDAHSGTTRIKIGQVVTIPRKACDSDSKVSCSRGLHAGGAGWLKRGYFGNQGLVALVNPADVVAVP